MSNELTVVIDERLDAGVEAPDLMEGLAAYHRFQQRNRKIVKNYLLSSEPYRVGAGL